MPRKKKEFDLTSEQLKHFVQTGLNVEQIAKRFETTKPTILRYIHASEELSRSFKEGKAEMKKYGRVSQDWSGSGGPGIPNKPGEKGGNLPESTRVFDYTTGWNLKFTPGEEKKTRYTLPQLRWLSRECSILRAVIEARKAQIKRVEWTVKPLNKNVDPATDSQTKFAKKLLKRPDGINTFQGWLNAVLEDLIVLDNSYILPEVDVVNERVRLIPIDATTIKRVIDNQGLTPQPPYMAYQQIIDAKVKSVLTADELIALQLNPTTDRRYGLSVIESAAPYALLAIDRLKFQASYYKDGNLPEAMISCPEGWNAEDVATFQSLWNAEFSGDAALNKRHRTKFLESGMKLIQAKDKDIQENFDEYLARIICFHLRVPPSALVTDNNRATADNARYAGEKDGMMPLLNLIEEFLDRILQEQLGLDVEFCWDLEEAIDPLEQAKINEIYAKNGIKTTNEIRADIGLEPIEGGDDLKKPESPGTITNQTQNEESNQ